MQGDANDTLVDVCDIKRATPTSDGQGGRTTVWATIHAAVPCSVAPTQVHQSEREIADRLSAQAAWTIAVPANTDVLVTDRVVVGARTFEVLKVSGARSWEIDRVLDCSETT